MSTSIIHKKNRIDKHPNNAQVLMDMIYQWTVGGELRRDEFFELMNYARVAISRNGKKPYVGNEYPEFTLG